MSIESKQNFLVEAFEKQQTWEGKYEYLIRYADGADKMPKEYKTEDNLIKGCQSRVWIHSKEYADGTMKFYSDADGKIIKGIVTMITEVFNNETPDDILRSNCDFIEKIGFGQMLSANRSNGVLLMIQRIRDDADMLKRKIKF